MAEEAQKTFHPGKIVSGRWRVVKKLGEGGMGAVYKVEDKKRKGYFAAMKVEDDMTEGGVLKLEVHVLEQLAKAPHAVRLLDSGTRDRYNFMVMTLCSRDLMSLKRAANRKPFSDSTTLRLAISSLYAIKQLHEIGYVHRDIKPGNCMMGGVGRDTRIIYLIDYGMVRAFTAKDATGRMKMRQAREGDQLFRGTPRYCSLNVHYRKEQCRGDDLWSWLYMLIELHKGLPWNRLQEEKGIYEMKSEISPEELLTKCPAEFRAIYNYLIGLGWDQRPDYHGLYSECLAGLKRLGGTFMDAFEWEYEQPQLQTALSISEKTAASKRTLPRDRLARKAYPFASAAYFKENILGF